MAGTHRDLSKRNWLICAQCGALTQKLFGGSKCRACRDKDQVEVVYRSSRSYHKYWLMHRYQLAPEEHAALLAQQDGKCAICKEPPPARPNGHPPMLFVDHDHKTGKVRGLLCIRCNSGIGSLRDDIDLLRAAIEYLQNYGN